MKWLASVFMLLVTTACAADELLIYHRPDCSGCVALHAAIDAGEVDTTGIAVHWIDCKQDPDAAKRAGVRGFPTSVLVIDGQARRRYVGFNGAFDYGRWLRADPRGR